MNKFVIFVAMICFFGSLYLEWWAFVQDDKMMFITSLILVFTQIVILVKEIDA